MTDCVLKIKNLDLKPKRGGCLAVNDMMKYISKLRFLHLYLATYFVFWYCCIAIQHGGEVFSEVAFLLSCTCVFTGCASMKHS